MTKEEEQEFRDKVMETIIPLVTNMTEDQIKQIMVSVEKDNPELPIGFADMLFQQIMVYKYNKVNNI
ncbi:hypothetical protein [Poseidonibacter ostreae]|jgi:tyrosyl-tRNA synthetase|uniref:Uncharacterized protein n=1 Tax=Poseidonibacter ostreae TaxID=2654171 RepID=A0A6L4WVG5_9BACT|nr:hypothetical protein [Poseidonibacter ostreae]KAB7887269.1 hypothetical protein GA417_02670 [Poseidonibacter ostreae]KAB7890500.1 hypothetical protein GBG19_03300 [Poseidonibacter ostreae]KAB7890907.1 hypothetical protein GBG18_08040 [Poseidonibacter ostreae]MAC84012.1 hypothetical protein [Arcobacter sp.]|tara:strand:- start:1071 stop:1271 length:201 start_codon:yes stop_codon:yes gene_type:complete